MTIKLKGPVRQIGPSVILEALPLAIFAVDEGGLIGSGSHQMTSLTGLEVAEAIGSDSWRSLFPAPADTPLDEVLRTGEERRVDDLVVTEADTGDEVRRFLRASPLLEGAS